MALKGKKPETIQKRAKVFFFGSAGVGKTTAALQFPKPYLIDTEKGAENDEYVELMKKSGALYLFTNNIDEIIAEVKALMTEKHEFLTLVIDPISVPYNEALDQEADRLMRKHPEDPEKALAFAAYKRGPDRKMRHLLNLLLRVDMNVLITAHGKPKWENGEVKGATFDAYTKIDFLFDLCCEVQKRGKDRVGLVHKTRIADFKDGETFEFTYQEFAKRYGKKTLEKGAEPVALATAEQVRKLSHLLTCVAIDEDVQAKWLSKCQAEDWSEMTVEQIDKCIEFVEAKLTPEGAK